MKLKFSDFIKAFTIIGLAINMISCGGDTKNETASTESQKVWAFPEHIRAMSESYKETTSAESQKPKPKIKLAFMTNATADFWSYGKAGAEKAASEHDDIEIEFKMGDGTAAKQREICDSLLVR